MSGRRIGPFIIDEPEFRYNNLLNDEGMNQLNIDDSNNTSSQSFMSHDRGNNEFSIWNNLSNDPPEPFQHHSNGFPSNRQQNSFFGIDDSSKAFTGGFFGSKDTRDLPSPIGTIPSSAATTNQFNMASQNFPVFTPRQQYIHTPSYNHQHHHPQQQQMPPQFPPSSSSSEQQKPSPAPKVMTAAEFHLTRFGSFRLSVSPPDSLMINNEEEEDDDEDEKTPTKK